MVGVVEQESEHKIIVFGKPLVGKPICGIWHYRIKVPQAWHFNFCGVRIVVLRKEIVASPPGKKLKNLSLLSGGEKTFTAISLLFAILKSRPVPFCVLDEVEAALDEVNVDSFGNYVKRLQEKTQFIIITHKKKTMEYADTL